MSRSPPDRVRATLGSGAEWVRRWVAQGDGRLLLLVTVSIYALFTAFSLALGFDADGTANTLRRMTFFAAVYAMLVLALNLQWGYAGLFNIGVAGFMAVGVYTMAILTRGAAETPGGLGLPLPVGILGGVVAATLFGVVVALPALRLQADYLAIVTLAFAEIARQSIQSRALASFSVGSRELGTGGTDSLNLPGSPIDHLLYRNPNDLLVEPSGVGEWVFAQFGAVGVGSSTAEGVVYSLFLVVVVALFYILLARIASSPFGRVLKAIREDDVVASALGKDTRWFKIQAFALGSALMGFAAILWFLGEGFANTTAFEPEVTFFIFVALVVGGAGSNTGSVVGAVVFATVLERGPRFVRRIARQQYNVDTSDAPNTIFEAVSGVDQFVSYVFVEQNLAALQVVLVGVLLVYLIQRRPQGLLGHRKETASSIDLGERGGEDQ